MHFIASLFEPVKRAPALLQGGELDDPTLLETLGKALFPTVAYLFLAPVLWLFFRRTWRELDVAAHEHQKMTLAAGGYNYRPPVLFVITAVVLTLQEYYGGREFYENHIRPALWSFQEAQFAAPGRL